MLRILDLWCLVEEFVLGEVNLAMVRKLTISKKADEPVVVLVYWKTGTVQFFHLTLVKGELVEVWRSERV